MTGQARGRARRADRQLYIASVAKSQHSVDYARHVLVRADDLAHARDLLRAAYPEVSWTLRSLTSEGTLGILGELHERTRATS